MSKEAFDVAMFVGSVAGSVGIVSAVVAVYKYLYARMMMKRGFYWRIGKMEEDCWMPIPGRTKGGKP